MDSTLTCLMLILLALSLLVKRTQQTLDLANNPLQCPPMQLSRLTDQCTILETYNRFELEDLEREQRFELARKCACQLVALPWPEQFNDHASLARVHQMTDRILKLDKYNQTYPPFMWSDTDVIVEGISIHYSMHDYMSKRFRRRLPASVLMSELNRELYWRDIYQVCSAVGLDQAHLYGYMENLIRMNPPVFYNLLQTDQLINMTYQASKICKIMLIKRLDLFKLKPDNLDLVSANPDDGGDKETSANGYNWANPTTGDGQILNELPNQDNIDESLRHASVQLMNCEHWQSEKKSWTELQQSCPMMISNELPHEWLRQNNKHHSAHERSRIAIYCSCQLLLYKATWAKLMEDKNVGLMSKALTNYMNKIRFPDVQKVPLWALHGWFEQTLKRFEENRRLSIKMIITFKHKSQDPKVAINKSTMDEDEALELLRRGCNLLMLNRNKGTILANEMRLIQYLDNLQYITMDPQFVFHLTLQDANLFKLHALSKICKPVMK